MKEFKKCPKCGGGAVAAQYHGPRVEPKTLAVKLLLLLGLEKVPACCQQEAGEHLGCGCLCGYQWSEPVKDATDLVAVKS